LHRSDSVSVIARHAGVERKPLIINVVFVHLQSPGAQIAEPY